MLDSICISGGIGHILTKILGVDLYGLKRLVL